MSQATFSNINANAKAIITARRYRAGAVSRTRTTKVVIVEGKAATTTSEGVLLRFGQSSTRS